MALESMAIDGAQSLLQMAAARGLDEFILLWGFRDDVSSFQNDFRIIQSLLSTVEDNSRGMQPPVRQWVKKVKEVAYEAQDLLDELSYENVRLQVEFKRQFKSECGKFFSSSNPIIFRLKMAHRVKHLKASIAEIYKLAKSLKSSMELLAPSDTITAQNKHVVRVLQQARDMATVTVMVGRESDKSKLLEELRTGKDALRVISIVGLPGMGKTTLARQVYEDESLKDKFGAMFWITVSQDFDIGRILQEMSSRMRVNMPSSVDATRMELQEQLRGKTYLVVLDDVWNTDRLLWDSFRETMQYIGQGLVLLTTRDSGVASAAQASLIYPLTKLNKDDSWSLFKQISFYGRPNEEIRKFEKTGREIVRKCQGLPLALKAIAGILRSEDHLRQWKKIEKSELWSLPLGDAGILPSLKLSFDHLPSPSLKQCFAFLAAYPKGNIMSKSEIISVWSALGYFSDCTQDIGETYLKALLNISFLLAHEKDDLGNITTFRMHDMVHDLDSSVNDECIIWKDTMKLEDASAIRMLTLDKNYAGMQNLQENVQLKRLRVIVSNCGMPNELLRLAKYLRILDLSWSGLEEVPSAIGGLKYQRLLDVGGNPIKALPESITRLYNLQTLRLQECRNLFKLPVGLGNLINLRHLTTSVYVKVPPGIARLKSLQTAPMMELEGTNEGSFQINELESLPDITGVLSIRGLQHVQTTEAATKAQLCKKDRVATLELIWNGQREENSSASNYEVLEALQPNQHLSYLKVQGYDGEIFPVWLQKMEILDTELNAHESFDSLVKLELIGCENCIELPELGQLQSLRLLRLQKMASVKKIGAALFYGCAKTDNGVRNFETCSDDLEDGDTENRKDYFRALKELIIEDFPSLEEWLPPADGGSTAFAHLEVLKIVRCPKLAAVPELNFSSLRDLVVEKISSDVPIRRILQNCCLQSLSTLSMKLIKGLRHLPEELSFCTSLRELSIVDCKDLSDLVTGNDIDWPNKLLSLQMLQVSGCSNELVKFPDFSNLVSLRELTISSCSGLTDPPSGLQVCTSLRSLRMNHCINMQIPDDLLPQLYGIEDLCLVNLKGVDQLFDGIQKLRGLKALDIGHFGEQYDYFPGLDDVFTIQSLVSLNLHGWDRLQSLPVPLQNFKALGWLSIACFNNLEELPEWLGDFSSLEGLSLVNCHKLRSLPSSEALKRPRKLWFLEIENCVLLEERCRKNAGEEWHKISHIREIWIGEERVQ